MTSEPPPRASIVTASLRGAPATASQSARSTAARLERRGLAFAVGTYLALRLFISAVGAVAFTLWPPVWANLPDDLHRGFAPLREGVEATFLGLWVRWDANWYLEIAREGYEAGDGSVVYPPLYPLLSRLAGEALGGHLLLGALLVANLACLAAFILFHRLARLELGAAGARRALLWLALFPASFYLFVPYTESLFLALAVGAFLAARTDRWPLAIALGMLAALTRVPGLLLAPALLVELAHEPVARWWRARRLDRAEAITVIRRALPLALIPAALGVYAAYAYFVVGDRLLWRHLETYWGLHWAPPWGGLVGNLVFLLDPPVLAPPDPVPWLNEGTNRTGPLVDLIVGPVFVILATLAFRLRPSYGCFAWLLLLSGLTKVDALELTQSLTRYVLVVFPAFLVLGSLRLPRPIALSLALTGLALLGLCVAWFVRWWWLW